MGEKGGSQDGCNLLLFSPIIWRKKKDKTKLSLRIDVILKKNGVCLLF